MYPGKHDVAAKVSRWMPAAGDGGGSSWRSFVGAANPVRGGRGWVAMTAHGPDASKVRHEIDRLAKDGSVVAKKDGHRHTVFPVAVSPGEGASLNAWVRQERASKTIEIGLGYGISALFICEALLANGDATARHVAIDPYQATRFADCGLQVLDDAGVRDLVDFYPEPSMIALPRLLSNSRTFDLGFVDGNHRFDAVFVDLAYLNRLVRPGGIVFLDDYQLTGVERAAGFWINNLGWELEERSSSDQLHQWAVLRTSSAPDARAFTHFVDF